MANKRRPPRKKHHSNHKGSGGSRENADSNRGGSEQRVRSTHQQRQQQQGKNFQRNQEFIRKSKELVLEKNSSPKIRTSQESGKLIARVIFIVSVLLLGVFSYFICENYHTKTPVYGKRGWDDTFQRSTSWVQAKEICEEKSKRLPGKDQLKTFSKRADQKLRNAGIFWSSSQDGEAAGYYFSVNFKDGSEISSPGTMKYNVICVK
ncbi:DUF1566 domain-containing protein [Leptospira noguchii]|uniref:LIC_10572 family protein n=1 Tax=Leptospira noguchii TaxID=28182 RepID=UPI0002BE4EE2|nr:DUF1566 domain-containing protein [Leptospira noguchii]EMI65593.1 hypothetical protein LEP1GSC072_0192 [Leptospira noguchii str. Bonito]EMS86336.1 hypothetical protein LEP1GSC073_2425 [Leptospira noguchii str. Cascata]UOG38233.1 DUF1566 domain-containing protein [Leptospira noguchii]UOG60924.1 DUF1566 domain-containing protein [Leptospira noguchii]